MPRISVKPLELAKSAWREVHDCVDRVQRILHRRSSDMLHFRSFHENILLWFVLTTYLDGDGVHNETGMVQSWTLPQLTQLSTACGYTRSVLFWHKTLDWNFFISLFLNVSSCSCFRWHLLLQRQRARPLTPNGRWSHPRKKRVTLEVASI